MKSLDVVALGEALIDFSPLAPGPMGNPSFEMNPGGAPLNCLAACVRLGCSGAFVGALGNDLFGRFLKRVIEGAGIESGGLVFVPQATAISFVSNAPDGEREFAFLKNPGADSMLTPQQLDPGLLGQGALFHFGSISLIAEPARSATMEALRIAKEAGAAVSFDPNYRPALWPSAEEAARWMRWGAQQADLIKVSLEEMAMITGLTGPEEGARALFELGGQKTSVHVTQGAGGAWYHTAQGHGFEAAFEVKAIDTTGCGDAFFGAVLYQHLRRPGTPPGQATRFANAAGALCATKPSGLAAMPALEEIEALLARHKR